MQSWRVHLFGQFRLVAPDGEEVRLETRKVEGLLAMLVLSGEAGVPKQEILQELWPADPTGNSLRQALHRLRKAIGDRTVESIGDVCRLSDKFSFDSDWGDPTLRTSSALMPSQLGDWFECHRLELTASDTAPSRTDAIDSLLVTLEWLAASDPNGFFAVMEAAPALVRGVPHGRLGLLARSVECRTALHHAWSLYWQGTAENDLQTCAGLLREALAIARCLDEIPLQSEICLEVGKVYSRLGQTSEALSACGMACDLAESSTSKTVHANSHRLEGTVRVHWGDYENGLRLLQRAEAFIDDPVEAAIAKSARALFSASVGFDDTAARLIAESKRLANGLEHDRVVCTSELAEVLIASHAGERDRAIERLVATCHRSSRTPSQIVVYANELLAKLYYLEGDRSLAHERFESARRERLASRMVMTRLEARRISRSSG